VNGALPSRGSLTVVCIFVAETSGSSDMSIVNIPFGFRAGHRQWNPGRYALQLIDEGVLGLRTLDTSDSMTCTMLRAKASSPSNKGTLVFVEQDGSYLLSKAFWPAGENLMSAKSVRKVTASADRDDHTERGAGVVLGLVGKARAKSIDLSANR